MSSAFVPLKDATSAVACLITSTTFGLSMLGDDLCDGPTERVPADGRVTVDAHCHVERRPLLNCPFRKGRGQCQGSRGRAKAESAHGVSKAGLHEMIQNKQ